jgi:hypothetical protein
LRWFCAGRMVVAKRRGVKRTALLNLVICG